MSDRRYRDDEVREIFERATRETAVGAHTPAPTDGLTLAELKRIGQEVGMEPERIERAARSLDRPDADAPRHTFLGAPLSVSRMVDLPRPMTDREWEILVADLRRTFQASGKTDSVGESRHWVNGNLHAFMEPADDGYRLRLGTLKGNARPFGLMSLGVMLTGLVLFVIALVSGVTGDGIEIALTLSGLGAAGLGANALRLLPWSARRRKQLDAIAERALRLTAPDGDDRIPDGADRAADGDDRTPDDPYRALDDGDRGPPSE